MTYDFPVAQTISFYYKVSSEQGYDYLRFYVDGTQVQEWSGSVSWTQFNRSITAGSHTLTWTYYKDSGVNTGDDRAWVDNITFTKVTSVTPGETLPASFVTIDGANISGDVFGGGKMGYTTGNTQVNVESGNIRGNVFGGAYGEANKIFVAGMHTVNIMGGRVFGNVYGGSRNANDALTLTNPSETETRTSSVVNISAGQIDQQVYTAGFYGHTYGSVYTFIGKEAILNAPHKAPSFGDENEQAYKVGNLRIGKNVWAGGDWGDFQGGVFGASTVKGYSDIYVNGEGYDTETTDESASTYMNIGGSILGCGTSCDAGAQGRAIYVSNYGAAIASGSKEDFNEPYTEATRTLYSIQRADTLILDNAHLNFTGLAKINSIEATEKYAIYSFDKTVRMTGGSSLFMNALASQIMDFWSASCANVYAANAEYSPVAYNQVEQTPNKIRVNGGNYIEIYHDKQINGTTGGYGMLNGFAYMMVAENASQNTCAYARPKQCQDTPIDTQYDNQNDGGWVSYDASKNTFDIDGNSHSDDNVTLGALVQMPYENHINSTKNGEQYFRIWRAGGVYSEREAVINILADGTNTFDFVDVSVKLPAWTSRSSYYIFQTQGDCPNFNTTIDYGSDVMMYNSALTAANTWVHFDEQGKTQVSGSDEDALDEIRNNPNVNFGLVTLPGTAMAGSPLLVCNESDAFLAKPDANCLAVNRFTMGDFEKNPEVTFRITYSNLISTNMTWDPMYVTLVQMDENGKETDIVKIALVINIATTIDREFTTQVYAIMNGMGTPHDEYTAKVVLPVFELADVTSEHASDFQLMSVEFTPANGANWIARGGTYVDSTYFAMEIAAANNEDNSDGWDGTSVGMKDSYTNQNANGLHMGYTGGRTPFAFDFRLTYNGSATYTGTNPELGVLKFTLKYDNVKEYDVDPDTGETLETFHATTKTLIIYVQVIRRGKGAAFYLDGQHGSNANDAKTPDKAALSLSTIFNRLGFLPGDVVYVVNTVDVNEELEWVGTRFDNVTLYRYPGGHPLSQTQKKDEQGHPLYWDAENEEETTESEGNEPIMLVGEIEDNPDNVAFTGVMVNVMSKGNMYIRDITLDGHNVSHPSPVATETGTDAAVVAEAPLIDIASGGTAVMTSGSTAQYNTNNAENAQGGAVNIQDGGKLMMNENAMIRHNQTSGEGGAVYMAGTLIVADSIHIDTNYVANTLENVFLAAADKVITIGTSSSDDDFDSLSYKARIGVTKQLTADIDGYTRVVNVDNNSVVEWLETPYGVTPNNIIYHDGHVYNLVKYSDPTYLYWIGTWLTVQPHEPTEEEGGWISAYDIRTDRQLAWLISLVNGENWQEGNDFEGETIQINADIDMDYSIWVPIGTATHPFKGTLEGNGHVITGIRTPLVNKNAGMMGYTEGATIQNMVVEVDITGNSENVGTLIGTMNGGSLNNVEAAGNIEGKGNTVNLGGLVGAVIGAADNQATIHSSFAVNTLTASVETTVVAGLVGTLPKYCSLYNSYANVSLGEGNASTHTGGLVGDNSGFVENCYVINPIGPAFAYTNNGNIKYCYVAKGNTNYVGSGDGTLTGHGSYDVVKGRKELGYMYGDNAVEIVAGENAYVNTDSIVYLENHIPVWNGLLSTLNQWVRDEEHEGYTLWNRPISSDINDDLPVLAFAKDSCLVTTDGKFLLYNAKLDSLLGVYKDTKADLFLYKSATGIKNVPGNNLHVFIHEDAALIQDNGAKGEFKATVGVTFDNSDHGKHSRDFWGNKLNYDWHLLSTPLSDAKLGITYGDNSTDYNYWDENDKAQAVTVANSYLPDMSRADMDADWPEKWDFYTYFEPQYHWINFKRNVNSHHHYDEPHDQIDYEGFEQTEEDEQGNLIAGRGYMAAINQDSYLSSTGTLNNGVVPIALTAQAPEDDAPDGFFTYDKGSNLVGNPYQAYLDLEVVADKTGMETFYIYDAEQGVYVPYEIGQSKNTVTPSQYIHPHQGFFVVTDKDNKDFAFTYEMATATKDEGSYFRANHIDYPLVNLFAENEQGNRDLAIIEFNRPVIGGAEKVNNLHNANFKIAAHLDGKGYGLLFTPEGTEKVPVHFRTAEDGTFTLRWETLNGTFTSLMLVDNLTGVRTNMLQEDHYTFNGSVDDYASRFYITYNVTSVDEIHGIGEEFAWFDGNDWIVTGKGQLEVIDVTGRVLQSRRVSGEQTRVNLHDVAAGVYMLRLTDGNKGKTQKIVIR